MKFKSIIPLLFLVCINTNLAICQTSIEADTIKPEIGKPMPDFTLTNVHHYNKSSSVSLNDFKGKWLFFDFWFSGCVNCIKSFPKVNLLQEKFKGKIQFLLVGVNEREKFFGKGIELTYEKLRQRQNLNLAIAYDSILNFKWDIWSMPHIIIVDPQGIVRYITDGRDMTVGKVQDLIDERKVSFYPKDKMRLPFDPTQISNEDVVYRSVLTRWNGEMPNAPFMNYYFTYDKKADIEFSMIPLYGLYNLAYVSKYSWSSTDSLYSEVYPFPVLEVKDSALFQFDTHLDFGKGLYNYSLAIPPNERKIENVMKVMQEDLKRCFGYTVNLEIRSILVWKLIAKPGAAEKLKTKTDIPYFSESGGASGAGGFEIRNASVDFLLGYVRKYISDYEPPFFNETGIDGNIDIKMDALMTNREQVIKALRMNGLDLVKRERLMKVIVVRDGKS